MDPRSVSVSLNIQGASTAIDITNDLIGLQYEDNMDNKGDCLDLTLSNVAQLYNNTWFKFAETQIGYGAPGSEGALVANEEYPSGPGYNQGDTGDSGGSPG